MTAAVPDYVEPFQGWRVWRVGGDRTDVRLLSVVRETVWPLREELVAQCLARRLLSRLRRPAHDPPAEACTCGIYATALERLRTYLDDRSWRGTSYVFGRVSLWGTVVECENGWRASRAYPAEIFVPTSRDASARVSTDDVANALRRYAVPVVVLPHTPAEAHELMTRGRRHLRFAR